MVPSVATKWYDLGLQLLDPKHAKELNVIEADTRDNVATCCRKMFSRWLNIEESPTWHKLLKALGDINLNNEASDIEQLLSKGKHCIFLACI